LVLHHINQLIFLGGFLIVVSIFAGLLSSRVGAPLLLVFLGLGMLVGQDGLAIIAFNDFPQAYFISSLGLAVILFDGGLRTPTAVIRLAWRPATALATVGVVITAGIVGVAASWALGVSQLEGMLIGAIVSSTDAAAVFLLLHQRGMELRKRVGATLEMESGVNDPMAVFLTITLVELASPGHAPMSWAVMGEFVQQMGVGAAVGLGGGYVLAWAINRVELAAGLYPVFAVAAALTLFGGAHLIEGSGFLAVYLAGLVAGNQRLRANQLIKRFHDGIAWLAQIVMFVLLGLLVAPHNLIHEAAPAIVVAVALIFVARPLAVALCLWPFGFSRSEMLFIAWVGLRGAVPIVLAMIPVLGGAPAALTYFNVAFVVVIASLLLQGWTVPFLARVLDVELPPAPEPTTRTDFDLMRDFDRDMVGYRVEEGSVATQRLFHQLPLPRRARVVTVVRGGTIQRREELARLETGDYVLAIVPPEQIGRLDRLFMARAQPRRRAAAALGDFAFPADTPLAALAEAYGLPVAAEAAQEPIGAYMQARLGAHVFVGERVACGGMELVVREVERGRIASVGLVLEPMKPALLPQRMWSAVNALASLFASGRPAPPGGPTPPR
jgi:cell volume regulation protein A